MQKKIKAYIVYGGSHEWWDATLVLENGWSAFTHLCSHPGYMAGDLLLKKPKRLEIFKAMGYEVEIEGGPIAGSDNAPPWLIEKYKDQSNWQEFADLYRATEANLYPTDEATK